MKEVFDLIHGKTVLVTGGGSIGSELCRQVAAHNPKRLIISDVYENNAYNIQLELREKHPELDLVTLIGSVRDSRKMFQLFEYYRPEIVYHAAAHKHVPLMEDSPCEAIKNNAELFRHVDTEFVALRSGNVLGSNGSVIPIFKKQIEKGGPVTVTHPDIIRYFMTIPEAVSLVLLAGTYAKGGEIFVLDMGSPVKIDTLARNLIRLSGLKPDIDIKIEYTGLRPGEKLYEEKLMAEEGLRKTENEKIHIGQPIPFDTDKFLEELEGLMDAAYSNRRDIRELVAGMVSTYHQESVDVVDSETYKKLLVGV